MYRTIAFLSVLILPIIACTEEPTKKTQVHLLPPNDLIVEVVNTTAVKLLWKDVSTGEAGYIIERSDNNGFSFEQVGSMGENASSYTDRGLTVGKDYSYKVMAYTSNDTTQAAIVSHSTITLTALTISTPECSSYMVSIPITLTDGGGVKCEVGICWKEAGTPTITDNVYIYSEPIAVNQKAYGNAVDLAYDKTYTFRAYAKNKAGITYSTEVTASLASPPISITTSWTEVNDFNLPQEVKLYSTITTINGLPQKIWYAVADLSTGNIELRTGLSATATSPTNYVKSSADEVYIMTNGGYFSGNTSYSFVADQGTMRAPNIAILNRTYSYTVMRGALGVDQQQRPSLKWIYTEAPKTYGYDKPLPVVDGENPLAPTATFPSARSEWNVYSGIGGAPILLKDGRICFDNTVISGSKYKTNYELLQTDIFGPSVRQPRTAIGYTPDRKKVILMVVDGRNSGVSEGVTLEELARLMMGVGCSDVLNLDGGGSSIMVAGNSGTLINLPVGGSFQRAVVSFVGFVKRK